MASPYERGLLMLAAATTLVFSLGVYGGTLFAQVATVALLVLAIASIAYRHRKRTDRERPGVRGGAPSGAREDNGLQINHANKIPPGISDMSFPRICLVISGVVVPISVGVFSGGAWLLLVFALGVLGLIAGIAWAAFSDSREHSDEHRPQR